MAAIQLFNAVFRDSDLPGASAHRNNIEAGGETGTLHIMLPDSLYKVVHCTVFHDIHGAAAESAAGDPRSENARDGPGLLRQHIRLKAGGLEIVPERTVKSSLGRRLFSSTP